MMCLGLAFIFSMAARGEGKDHASFGPFLEKTYQEAKIKSAAETNGIDAHWKFARACFDWADFSNSNSKREEIAKEGIAASRHVLELKTNSVEGHYYLAMNLGELAETKTVGALKLVPQMETEFKTALSIKDDFDYAGPDRNLGLLYLQAPGWPLSIGSKSKSRHHLQQALIRSPEYPENLLNLIEAELTWNERPAAAKHLDDLDKLWPKAKTALNTPEWEINWVDWDARRIDLRNKIKSSAQHVVSPRGASEK